MPNFASAALSLAGPMVLAGRDDGTIPTARRTFNPSEVVTAVTHVWQGGRGRPEPVTVAARIVDTGDREVWQQQMALPPAAFDEDGAASHTVGLPLADLVPGDYVFAIAVTRDGRTLERFVRFAVP